MGTRVAPTYANIFMNDFEENWVYTYKHKPIMWFRFIDDVISIFRGTEEEVIEFILYLNHQHVHVQFTANYAKDKMQFLDIWVLKKQRFGKFHIETDLLPNQPTVTVI